MPKTWRALALALLVLSGAMGKTARVLRTDAEIAAARQLCETADWAKEQRDQLVARWAWLVAMSDEALWDFVPPAEQRRALNVSFGVGCPVHGTEVFRKGGHYPWITSRDKPFKVTCPVGGETYPSNDFQPWRPGDHPPEQGPGYVDHGTGWVDAQGRRYWFVGYYLFWHRWRAEVLPAVGALGQLHLLTGDPVYAHKAGVLLCRLAAEYDQYHYPTQAYHSGHYPSPYAGRILDRIWMTGVVSGCAAAYDAIWPTLAGDAALAELCRGKGLGEPRRGVEQRLLGRMANDIFDNTIRGNNGMHQQALATVAAVLQNDDPDLAPTTAVMRDWLLHGAGDIEQLLWNGFYRDGHGGESSPGYSMGWNTNFYQVARLLPHLGVDIFGNPKVRKMADLAIDLTVAGEFAPSIGDSGSIKGSRRLGWGPAIMAEAFQRYGDPRYAQALKASGARLDDLWTGSIGPAVDAAVAQHGTELVGRTRDLGGYGLAVLEGGAPGHRRGLSIYYGHAGGGHGHLDRLSYELFAFGRPMLTDHGYPAHWLEKNTFWTSNTISHYAVLVDQMGQQTSYRGSLVSLASTPQVQFAEVEADRVAYPRRATQYRRATALVDLDETACYLVDVFRVTGGAQHDWSFHGPPFPGFTTRGLELSPPAPGTLAGEDIPFGAKLSGRQVSGGGQVLDLSSLNGVVKGPEPYAERSRQGWAAYQGTQLLTRRAQAELRSTPLDLPAGDLWLHLNAYDYNQGRNTVEVLVGNQRAVFEWGEGGDVGWGWLPAQQLTVPGGPTEVRVVCREAGQTYALVDGLILANQPTPPVVRELGRSGFQYLSKPRRARPAGDWSATWSQPDEDLHLTVTVPAGAAQEVILADAEPELAPGMPERMEYLIGRNQAAAAPLQSTYVAVIEPHQGAARVQAVRRLTPLEGPPQAVVLLVERAGETDLIYSSPDPAAVTRVELAGRPVTLRGRFVRATLRDGQPVSAALVEGGGLDDLAGEPSPTGTVAAIDAVANTITLDQALADPARLIGRVVILGNDRHQTSYLVRTATTTDGRTVLGFGDVLFLVGVANVTGTEAAQHLVTTNTLLGGYGKVDGGQHQGRWLLNEAQQVGPRIASLPGTGFVVESFTGDLGGFFGDSDADGRVRAWIADVGPGDTWRIPGVTAR